jgi:putative cardiolipin synthase
MTLIASPTWPRWASVLVLALGLASCAALPPMPPREATQALAPGTPTPLAAKVAAPQGAVGSGLRVIENGIDALAILMQLADESRRTLDLQYYAVLNDTSARVLMQRVRAAAERGVRVRLLVDDLATTGADDALLRLTRHPRIEVRLYNPLPAGRFSAATKILASLHDAERINSRMHNKAFIADNALAVTGGRNIGDPYFIQAAEANFVDLDMLVAGPVVHQLSRVFDRFWNSELAYPVSAIVAPEGTPGSAAPLDTPDALPDAARAGVQKLRASFAQGFGLKWAPAHVIADRPSKTLKEGEPNDAETMFDELGELLQSARRDVLIVTPYFVPGDKGMALIQALRARGVHVRVLTAALAATDAPVVHVGYSKYRPALLAAGVELYELRPEFAPEAAPRRGGVHSKTNLHSKAVVVDGATVLVGSMNIDPRSDKHNTEMGLLLKSAPVSQQLMKIIDHACREGAYRVTMDGGGELRWRYTERDGRAVEFDHEPRVSWPKRVFWRLLAPLAPETLL